MKHRTKSLRILLAFLIYGMSQTPPRASELSEEPQSNIFKQIILDNYMGDSAKELWNLRLVSREFHGFVNEKFKTLNIQKQHLQWVDYPLSEPMLYFCNTRLMIVLSYIYNQSINQASKKVDHPRFMQNARRLLDQEHLPNAPFGFYVAYFSQNPDGRDNLLDTIQNEIRYLQNQKSEELEDSEIKSKNLERKEFETQELEQEDPEKNNPNLMVLYQHFLWTWNDMVTDPDTVPVPVDPEYFVAYENLRGSFSGLLNPQLLEAKRQLPLSDGVDLENWLSKILSLDPSPTYWQLDHAGHTAYENGSFAHAAEWFERSINMSGARYGLKHIIPRIKKLAQSYQQIGRYRWSAYYWNQYISFIQKGSRAREINVDDYRESANANYYAENFGEAATYWRIYLKLLKTTRQEISAEDYKSAAMAFYDAHDFKSAGNYYKRYFEILATQDKEPAWQFLHDISVSFYNLNNFKEASGYCGRLIQAKLKSNVKPSSEDYKYAAILYAASNRFKSAAYFGEQYLKSLGPEDDRPEPPFYEKLSNYYLHGNNFRKAAHFYDSFLESLQERAEPIALSYMYRGAYLHLRAQNFERAMDLFEMELSALAQGGYELRVPIFHNTILIDLYMNKFEDIEKSLKLFIDAYRTNPDSQKLNSLRRVLVEKGRTDELDFLDCSLKPKSQKKKRLKKF